MTTIGSVEDYAALRKLVAGEHDFILVRRGTSHEPQLALPTPPDGGIFAWDEVSTENENYGTIITPNVVRPNRNGRWKRLYCGRINVKWFDAKGDGVTDDLVALKNAADAAKRINADLEIPAGNYLISGPWELSGKFCNIMGIGLVTIQCLNPSELARIERAVKDTNTIKVSSTNKFSSGQRIKVTGIDAKGHMLSDVYNIKSINPSERVLDLKEKLNRTYDPIPFDPVTRKGNVIVTAADDAVIQFNESVESANIENIRVEGLGPLLFSVQRSGISFKGKGSLKCFNVESFNHSQNGVFIYAGKRNEKDDKYLKDRHFSFNGCNMHDNGYAGIYGAPFVTITKNDGSTEILTGSVQVIGGIYSNNGPEWSGSSAYGITLNGSKTVINSAMCENNTGPQIDLHSQYKSSLIVHGCTLAWGKTNDVNMPGGMVDVAGECETLIVEGCDMDGSGATFKQMYGVSAGGFQTFRTGIGSSEKGRNHETMRIVNNVFRNMNFTASSIYITPWDVKSVEIIGNTFINCLRSIIVDNQEHPDKFDPLYPRPAEAGTIMGYDKRMIPDIVRIEQNTLIDSGDCSVFCGGLIIFSDNVFIRKYLESYTIPPFMVDVLVGRVGRIIRKNNKAIGLKKGIYTHSPSTAVLPTHFHWSVGDYESNESPLPGGFLGYVCTVAGTAEDTKTHTTATTHAGTTTIDVKDCTVFCQQQWISVKGETFSKSDAVRILRVIGLGHRLGPRNRDDPAGYPGQLITEFPADKGVTNMDVAFQKAAFAKINMT